MEMNPRRAAPVIIKGGGGRDDEDGERFSSQLSRPVHGFKCQGRRVSFAGSFHRALHPICAPSPTTTAA